jgi:putative glutamine amidotransferase
MSVPERPVVGLSACQVSLDGVPNFACRHNYVQAVERHAGCLPIVLPAIGPTLACPALLDRIDGLVLTGSASNVDPTHYGQQRDESKAYDEARDATTFALIHAAVAIGVPILAICRGLHEVNVALGGSLFQNLHQVGGKMEHREDESQPRSIQYAPVHRVRLTAGGVLNRTFGVDDIQVSSVHWQGIDRLGEGLLVEAVADDGLIEAVTLRDAKALVVGVQWHPEWFAEDPHGRLLFRRFGRACRLRQRSHAPSRAPILAMPAMHARRAS